MAPKSGTKRAAQVSKATQPAKVQKKAEEKKVQEAPTYSDPLMKGIVDAIERSMLPDTCKEMLLLMTPSSFTVPTEERHEVQAAAVRMVGETMQEMQDQMMKEIEEANTAVESAEAEKTSLDATVVEAKSQLTIAGETVQSKEGGLQDAINLAIEKQALFDNTKEAQTKGDSVLEATKSEKESYSLAFTNSYKALCSPDFDEQKAAEHYKVIEPLLAKLQIDESLRLALPSTCQKKPSDRGPFDNVIMGQLEKALQTHMAALDQQIEGGASAAADRASVVQTAEQELNEANDAKAKADQELCNAQTHRTEATEFVESSEKAIVEWKLKLESTIKARDEKVSAHSAFAWNMSCFAQLKEKSAASKEIVPPAETTPVEMEVAPLAETTSVETAAPKEIVADEAMNAPVTQAGA